MHSSFSNMAKSIVFCSLLVSGLACAPKPTEEDTASKKTSKKDGDALPDGLTPEQAAKVVAKVGQNTITVGDVTRQINRLSPYIRRRWAAPEKRKEFLDKLIRVELLSQEAERLGLSEDPEVQRTVKQMMIRLMVKNDLEKELFPTEIDEATLKAEYEKEKDKYHRPAQVRASQVVLKTKPEAEKLLKDLKANATDARYFRQKAKELSIDQATKERSGDLGYFSKPAERSDNEPDVPQAVAEAVWKLENTGDMADEIVKSDAGYHIVKLTNKREEMNRSFESVKRMIENRLLREKRTAAMDKFIEDLKNKAKIEIFEENLAKLKVDAQGALSPPGPRAPHAGGPAGPALSPKPKKTKPKPAKNATP
ncbi:MAG: peptidyl-prolyl cis-trans isomerase [Myxococcota bacterium]|nr:peptidyl-prolyl cis-trans isomerase [Myxococcota bacterium]